MGAHAKRISVTTTIYSNKPDGSDITAGEIERAVANRARELAGNDLWRHEMLELTRGLNDYCQGVLKFRFSRDGELVGTASLALSKLEDGGLCLHRAAEMLRDDDVLRSLSVAVGPVDFVPGPGFDVDIEDFVIDVFRASDAPGVILVKARAYIGDEGVLTSEYMQPHELRVDESRAA